MPLPDGPIPTYRIDVALPPEQRYVEVARDFAPRMRDVTNVFDELLLSIFRYPLLCRVARFCAKALFRRLYDDEHNREVRSISKTAGVDLYLVIALNILLDALMSCTAGCILTEPRRSADGIKGSRLMHFRTLDWGMDPLRELLIVVEFVDSRQDPELVIATSVTYAGFVGTLTAARPGLSLSLNYRPTRQCSKKALRKHQLLVLLGFRPSISSILRSVILDKKTWPLEQTSTSDNAPSPLLSLATRLAKEPSSPCYLTLSDSKEAVVIEKDLHTGKIKTSNQFIVQANHDTHSSSCCRRRPGSPADPTNAQAALLGQELFLEDSEQRMGMMQEKWLLHTVGSRSSNPEDVKSEDKNGLCLDEGVHGPASRPKKGVRESFLEEWMMEFPIINECTHYACIMDPLTGKVRWLQRGMIEYDPGNPRF
ncbi:beta subunit of N-acylethanolamine-hydrolyzing acid amidase-domain-containing protein [Plectosphaerella cucumerina]|uniref:ceramidase n=1 Tax=Plectosphaerella cucumerina TaxID=40658 RepID=A0A8K0TU32_9PEZI|nr:beta subunit of N-acylethanolamine-hydrolyzing acid amidase-domain-containing protein [Plectosphaerella cucumerina]